MAEQGSYPMNGRSLQATDTLTGVVTGQTADVPLSTLALFVSTGGLPQTNIHGVLVNEGTSINATNPGISGQPLLSGGSASDPAYGTLGISGGGTGQTNASSALFAFGGSLILQNIAALQAAIPTNNPFAFVLGYYAEGDGGGGQYYYSASTPQTSANGGTIIPAFGGVGCWLLDAGTAGISLRQFGAKGDGVTDDTAAVQAAFSSFGVAGGKLFDNGGVYAISQTINCYAPVIFDGAGMGDAAGPVTNPATEFLWIGGGGGTMFWFGGQTYTGYFTGGGISNCQFNANSIAGTCLYTIDCVHSFFRNIFFNAPATYGWHMTNTGTLNDFPSGFYVANNLFFQCAGAASGIFVDGKNSGGPEGVTLCNMTRIRINHAAGNGVVFGYAGDNFVWEYLFTFRANSFTSAGVLYSSASTSSICGGGLYLGCSINGGVTVVTPGSAAGTRFINVDRADLASNAINLFGAGGLDVDMSAQAGYAFGAGLIPNARSYDMKDTMNFMSYAGPGGALQTFDKIWGSTGSAGSTITDQSGTPGGAVNLSTGATNGNFLFMHNTQSLGNGDGPSSVMTPIAYFSVSPLSLTNVIHRMGFFAQAALQSGVWIEYNYTVDGNWHLVTANGGSLTRTTIMNGGSPLGAGVGQQIHFLLYWYAGQAAVSFAVSGFPIPTPGATSTTNVTNSACSMGCNIQTFDGNSKSLIVYEVKMGTQGDFI